MSKVAIFQFSQKKIQKTLLFLKIYDIVLLSYLKEGNFMRNNISYEESSKRVKNILKLINSTKLNIVENAFFFSKDYAGTTEKEWKQYINGVFKSVKNELPIVYERYAADKKFEESILATFQTLFGRISSKAYEANFRFFYENLKYLEVLNELNFEDRIIDEMLNTVEYKIGSTTANKFEKDLYKYGINKFPVEKLKEINCFANLLRWNMPDFYVRIQSDVEFQKEVASHIKTFAKMMKIMQAKNEMASIKKQARFDALNKINVESFAFCA